MKKLLFGTAGIPICTKGDTISGIKKVRELGLDSMELEFVRGVNIKTEKAPEIKKVSLENDVVLTCHAPYYINLNSPEKKKYYASIYRIEKSCEIASLCGGYSVCFHPGYYLGQDPLKVYPKIKKAVEEVVRRVKEKGHEIWIRPETTGKETQFGTVDELIHLSQDIEGILPCVDFSHLHARTGKYNSYLETKEVLGKIEKELGKECIKNMHIHLSGIDYGAKGEKKHLVLDESDLKYKEILRAWKEFKIGGVVICESPNIEEDAMLLKKYYENHP